MSSFRNIKITCSACSTEGSYTVWDSVNVDLDPELKVKVMDGSLFTWTCPNCKKSFNAPYNFKDWADGEPMGIGETTYKVLSFGDYVEKPFDASKMLWEMSHQQSSANGGVIIKWWI